MKSQMRWFFVVCLLVVGCASPGVGSAPYLPRDEAAAEGDGEFLENWVGGQLRAMGEPSLQNWTSHNAQVFRLTVLPSFQPAYSIRVTADGDGWGAADFTLLDGAGGYAPGRVQARLHQRLSPQRLAKLRHRLEAADFWNLSISTRRTPAMEDGEEIICLDGALFVVEAVVDGRYHIVMPENCPGLTQEFADVAYTFRETVGWNSY